MTTHGTRLRRPKPNTTTRVPTTKRASSLWLSTTPTDTASALDFLMENFSVVVRFRPTSNQSSISTTQHQSCIEFDDHDDDVLTLIDAFPDESPSKEIYHFRRVAKPSVDQPTFYRSVVRPLVEKSLQGYNGTVIAFGPSGSGKTYTLSGIAGANGKGVIERASEQILSCIRRSRSGAAGSLIVLASFCLIHREIVSDLLLDRASVATRSSDSLLESGEIEPRDGLEIRDGDVIGLSQHVVRTSKEVEALVRKGNQNRCVIVEQRETSDLSLFDDEDESLRSAAAHTVFSLTVEHAEMSNSFAPISGTLMFVDMAASESLILPSSSQAWTTMENVSPRRSKLSFADASLRTFVKVIRTLNTNHVGGSTQMVPYRNSALTSLLCESLGGNCNTVLICNLSSSCSEYHETKHAITVAHAATVIKNTADRRDLAEHALMSAYLREMRQKYRVVITREDCTEKSINKDETAKQIASHVASDIGNNRDDRQDGHVTRLSKVSDTPMTSQEAANALAEAAIQNDDDNEDEIIESVEVTQSAQLDNAQMPANSETIHINKVGERTCKDDGRGAANANSKDTAINVCSDFVSESLQDRSGASVVDTKSANSSADNVSNEAANVVTSSLCTLNGESGDANVPNDVKSEDQVYPFSYDEEIDADDRNDGVHHNEAQDGVDAIDALVADMSNIVDQPVDNVIDNERPTSHKDSELGISSMAHDTNSDVPKVDISKQESGFLPITSEITSGATKTFDEVQLTNFTDVATVGGRLSPLSDNMFEKVAHESTSQTENAVDFEHDVGMERLVQAMCRPGSGVPRTFHGTRQDDIHRTKGSDVLCSGASLVVWIWNHVEGILDSQEAEQVCQHLLDSGVICHSEGSSVFGNADTLFYYIRQPRAAPSAWKTVEFDNNREEVVNGLERVHSAQSRGSSSSKKMSNTSYRYMLRKVNEENKNCDQDSVLEDFVPEDEDVIFSSPSRQDKSFHEEVEDTTDDYGLVQRRGIILSELIDSINETLHPLHHAAATGERAGVLQNLVLMCGVDLRDKEGRTPAMYAIVGNQIRCLNLLLQCGADVHTTDKAGNTPLLWAVYGGHHAAVASLLKNGAFVSLPDPQGCTALHWATRVDSPRCLELLLKHSKGEGINNQDKSSLTALHWAVAQDKAVFTKILLKHYADPCVIDSEGRTVADYAILKQACTSLKVLLDHQPDLLRQRGTSGWTPLHLASSQESADCLQILLGVAAIRRMDITCTDLQLATPLHWAVLHNRPQAVKFLLSGGINENSRDCRGCTALDYAKTMNFEVCQQILEADSAVTQSTDNRYATLKSSCSRNTLGARQNTGLTKSKYSRADTIKEQETEKAVTVASKTCSII